MATTITTIDKGDFICWTVLDGGRYTVWDVGVAKHDSNAREDAWVDIVFKRLGATGWPSPEITQVPIDELNFCDNARGLEKKLRAQQGDRVWCIRFEVVVD